MKTRADEELVAAISELFQSPLEKFLRALLDGFYGALILATPMITAIAIYCIWGKI